MFATVCFVLEQTWERLSYEDIGEVKTSKTSESILFLHHLFLKF